MLVSIKIKKLESIKKCISAGLGLYVFLLFFFSFNYIKFSSLKESTSSFQILQSEQTAAKVSSLLDLQKRVFFTSEKEEKFDDDDHSIVKKIDNNFLENYYFLQKIQNNFYDQVFVRKNPLFLIFQQLKLPY